MIYVRMLHELSAAVIEVYTPIKAVKLDGRLSKDSLIIKARELFDAWADIEFDNDGTVLCGFEIFESDTTIYKELL